MTSTNELGATVVFDGEVPRTITYKAREAISGGEFVLFSGTGNSPTGSQLSSYTSADIEGTLVSTNASGVEQINGIALADVASGAYGTAATRGAYIVKAGGSVIEGTIVEAMGNHSVQTLSSGIVPAGFHSKVGGAKNIGRAVTPAASGTSNYAIVYLNI